MSVSVGPLISWSQRTAPKSGSRDLINIWSKYFLRTLSQTKWDWQMLLICLVIFRDVFLWFFFSSDIFSGQVVMSGTKPKLRTQVPILHQIIIMKIRILFEIRKHNFGQDLTRIKPVQLWKGTNWVVVPPFLETYFWNTISSSHPLASLVEVTSCFYDPTSLLLTTSLWTFFFFRISTFLRNVAE